MAHALIKELINVVMIQAVHTIVLGMKAAVMAHAVIR